MRASFEHLSWVQRKDRDSRRDATFRPCRMSLLVPAAGNPGVDRKREKRSRLQSQPTEFDRTVALESS